VRFGRFTGLAQAEWGSEGREFESHRPDHLYQGLTEIFKHLKNLTDTVCDTI
jgi:hypothetical protein